MIETKAPPTELGLRLQQLRLEHNLSQVDFAKTVGMHHTTYANIEKQGNRTSNKVLKLIADFCNADYEELVRLKNDIQKETNFPKKINQSNPIKIDEEKNLPSKDMELTATKSSTVSATLNTPQKKNSPQQNTIEQKDKKVLFKASVDNNPYKKISFFELQTMLKDINTCWKDDCYYYFNNIEDNDPQIFLVDETNAIIVLYPIFVGLTTQREELRTLNLITHEIGAQSLCFTGCTNESESLGIISTTTLKSCWFHRSITKKHQDNLLYKFYPEILLNHIISGATNWFRNNQ